MDTFRDLPARIFYKHPRLLAFVFLAAISFVAYVNALPNSFHFDDVVGVVRNPTIRDLKYIPSYFTDPSTFALGRTREWRPVLQITYALNYSIAGLNPIVFRVFNLLFHLGTAFLIFLVITEICEHPPRKLQSDSRVPVALPALFAASLFAVHTANTEAVDYIWARSSVLATFFYLLAFYCFLRGPFSDGRSKQLPWHAAGLLSFALGVGTKATAVTLPAVLVLYEILFLNPAGKSPPRLFLDEPRRIKKYIPVIAVFFAYLAIRTLLLPRMFTNIAAAREVSSLSYLLTQFRAWIYYLKLFLWPHPLLVDFAGFGWSHSLWDIKVLLSLGLISALLVVAWRVRRTKPLISFFAFWYFVALLPEASFIPLADAVVGYRAYPAYIALAVIAAMLGLEGCLWLWNRFGGSDERNASRLRHLCVMLGSLVLAALIAATIARNRDWRDGMTLWSDVIQKDPANPRAYMMLGAQFLNQEDYENAKEMLEHAIRLRPGRSHAYVLRGYLNSRLNRHEEALSDLDRAVQLDSRAPYAYFYRGELHRRTGEYEKALADYHAALRFLPFYTDAYLGLAMTHLEKHETAKAIEACTKLVGIDPEDRRGDDCLGNLFIEQGRFPEAVALYQQGTRRIPRDSGLWYGLGVAHEKNGNYEEAGNAFEKAGRLTSETNQRSPIMIPLVE